MDFFIWISLLFKKKEFWYHTENVILFFEDDIDSSFSIYSMIHSDKASMRKYFLWRLETFG